ncbi:hypothetical protein [Brasilonema sp. UFV-L1]|uniref:hypothetical protein n=1 Tax=Brasilonema sp. UFV-L1 TaxID=2234130 RepID=UPI00145F9EB8|nr:hypothetical protein [Brasilonema sp. UFV-L1]NMG10285.1 hypothetical protein [Brasilonema sp. UFV-L1]
MAIRVHGFMSSGKRYIQVENQPHHITGIFRTLMHFSKNTHQCTLKDAENAYFRCEEDGTITFYQAENFDVGHSAGIWTYLVYECPEGEEKVFPDSFIDTSVNPLKQLFAGYKIVEVTVDIKDYLKYQYIEDEYLDVQLPCDWNTLEGRKIANLLLEEFKAFKSSTIFTERAGKEYRKAVLNGFIKAAQEVLENGGTLRDFESAQYDVLKKIRIDDIANLILEYNDYRIWQAALPSKSKAVEYAFSTALKLICRIK